ncbi:hypothetical protein Naga_100178g11, partial [Nannochloropsis gaditana]
MHLLRDKRRGRFSRSVVSERHAERDKKKPSTATQGKSWKGCAVSSKSKKGCFCPLASSSSTAQGPLSRRVLVPSLRPGYLITLLAVDFLLKGNLPCADAFLPRVHSQARLWARCTRSVPCLTPLQPRSPSSPGAQIAPSTDGIDPTFPAPPQVFSTPDACLSPSPVIPVRRAPVNLTTPCALTLAFPDVERRSTREGTPGYPEASKRHQVPPAHISQANFLSRCLPPTPAPTLLPSFPPSLPCFLDLHLLPPRHLGYVLKELSAPGRRRREGGGVDGKEGVLEAVCDAVAQSL